MPSWKKLITSGSAGSLSSLSLDTALPVSEGGTGATSLTSNGILTGNGTSAIQAESNLTFDGTNLNIAVGGKLQVDEVEGKSNNTNTLLLDDDQTGASNMVSLQSINHINVMTDGNNNGTGNFRVYNGSYDTDTADLRFQVDSAGVTTAYAEFRAVGDVIAYHSSDKRLKDNIVRIENPLEKVGKIGGYEFDWNDKQKTYEGHDVGVIAQEIQEVLPELVTERDNGYLAVKYEKIVPLLIESIKELKQEVDEIKQKCDCLKD